MTISFDDVKVAYASKTDWELRQAWLLFRSMTIPGVSAIGPAILGKALHAGLPLGGLVKATLFSHFCGGESIEDAQRSVARLGLHNVHSILDYSVEGAESESVFDATADEIIRTIGVAAANPRVPFAVFKVSGLARSALLESVSSGAELTTAERAEWSRVIARARRVCAKAANHNVRVMIDAEESWIQPAIDGLALELSREMNRDRALVHNTAQMYRVDRLDYIRSVFEIASREGWHPGFKVVRGAYMEKERARARRDGRPSPICADKPATDVNFDAAVAFIVNQMGAESRASLVAGTHNEASCLKLVDAMASRGLAHDDSRVWFSQLLGMCDHISFNLAHARYNVAKYMPYGPVHETMPYLIRRAEENSSVAGQAGREIQLIERALRERRRA